MYEKNLKTYTRHVYVHFTLKKKPNNNVTATGELPTGYRCYALLFPLTHTTVEVCTLCMCVVICTCVITF